MKEELLNSQEAAAYIGMTPKWLQNVRRHNLGPKYVKLSYRTLRYRKSDLDAWLASRSTGGEDVV